MSIPPEISRLSKKAWALPMRLCSCPTAALSASII
jgi:hypothetical protein